MVSTILTTLILALLPMGTPAGGQGQSYAQTRSPHGNLNPPCQNCHTSLGWKPIRAVPEFDHNRTKFPLRGMHEGVTCIQCHTKPVFSNVGTRCADCHADIHKRQLGANCESCHTVRGWMVSVKQIQNHQNRFPLLGAHAAVECDACHKNGALSKFSTMPTDCYSCHASNFKQTTNPNHVSAGFVTTCDSCHGVDNWMSAKFDHAAAGFPLTGAHATAPCASCHVNNNYNLTSANTACASCHLKDFQKTTNPNHVSAGFAQTCQTCHTTTAWQPATFDHSKSGFPLTGAHATAPCASCHVNNNYNLTSANTACVSCHLKDFQGTNNPNHAQQNFAQTCQTCHTTTAWQPAQFDHSKSGFPLTGVHATTPCASCHVNNNYNLTNTTCVSCHLKDYQGTNNPNHAQQGFAQTCETCHNTAAWQPAQFDHSKSGFPLTGTHATTPCAQCHVNNNYNITNTACVSCHLKDYQGTTDPSHAQANIPQTCQQCHNTTNWGNATFNHASTGWPLTGFHATTPCAQCHVNGNYNLTNANTACVGCHLKDYQATNDPNHAQVGFPTTCQQCHNTTDWGSGTFDHSTTGWALTGFHLTTPCQQCHVNGNYNLTSANTACVGCHLKDYQATNNPNHVQAGFPQTCQQCHNTTDWGSGTFNHATTGWALTGFHGTVPCQQCHVNGNYNLTSANTQCQSCHMADYNTTNAPPHAASGFPTDCSVCHSTTNWLGATFNHATTGWPLTGFHATVQCSQCHINNNYKLTSTLCVTCHLADFQSANNPNHVTSGFPQQCDVCHNTTAWIPSIFNHNNTPFPLTGFHTTVPCAQCHVNNNYTSLPTDCYSCHKTDYNGTTNPNHASAGFPTTCATCHTTTSWLGATFNHTYFPTNHGGANGVCSTCHTNPNDYTVFTCTNCHQKAQTDSNHQGVSGYIYNSTNCYNCHKNGGGG